MNKTEKVKLFNKLEGRNSSQPPDRIESVIVDAMFFLHTQVDLPVTYGKVADTLLEKLMYLAPRVDFVCDVYVTPSIKGVERDRRGSDDTQFTITGPDQTRPRDWQKSLRSPSFKTALFRFISTEWSRDKNATVLQKFCLFFAFEEKCNKMSGIGGKVIVEPVSELGCSHEEADTRIVWHLKSISMTSVENVVVRTNDTDVFILLLYHVHKLDLQIGAWMDVGL